MERRIFLGGMAFGAMGLLSACGGDDDSDGGSGSGSPGHPDTLTRAKLAEVFANYVGEYDVYPNFWKDGKYLGTGAIGSDFSDCVKYRVKLASDGAVTIYGNTETYTFGPDDLIEDMSQDVGYEIYVNFKNADGIGMKWQASSGDMDKKVSPDDGFFIMMGEDEWANPDNWVGLYSEDMMGGASCAAAAA